MAQDKTATGRRTWKGRGFRPASALVAKPVRAVSESRGFAVSRLLTHWEEIAGAEVARIARPVDISYGRRGMGATLTLLTTGAHGPTLQMHEPRLRERINACYGYAAIARIHFTQTSATGFAEGQAVFTSGPATPDTPPRPEITRKADALAGGIHDTGLRDALARLGANVLTKSTPAPGPSRGGDDPSKG